MNLAENLQWVVPLGIGVFGTVRAFSRTVVSYASTILILSQSEQVKIDDKNIYRLGAARIVIKNNSLRHLRSVSLLFRDVKTMGIGKFTGSTIGEIEPPDLGEDALKIDLLEMPAREIITVDILYGNPSLLGFPRPSGGGSRYRLQEHELYILERRSFWLQVSIAALLSFVFLIWLKRQLG